MAFPGTYNFSYYRGDTYQFVIRPKNANGTAMDLTDFAGHNREVFTISTRRGPLGIPYQVEASASIDTINNIVTCTITPDQGNNLDAGTTYVYDVQIDNGADVVYTLLTGSITVTDDISGTVA